MARNRQKKAAERGIVAAVKLASNPLNNVYTVLGSTVSQVRSIALAEPLDIVEVVRDEGQQAGQCMLKASGRATRKEYDSALDAALGAISGGAEGAGGGAWAKELDDATARMWPALKGAARRLMGSIVSCAPVMARFHNDCDGASGAVALYNAISDVHRRAGISETSVSWQMNRSIAYSTDLMGSDSLVFNSYASVEKPLVFITDFGTSQESEGAIRACSGKYDLVWLDHHPVYDGFPRELIGHYVNPWDFGSGSDYTAGFLTSTLAELVAPIDAALMKRASLIGDYSQFADRADRDSEKAAVVLDYLTGKQSYTENLTPKYMDEVIRDRERLNEVFNYASNMVNEALELGVKNVRHYRAAGGLGVYVLDFRKVSEESREYPLPGRYASKLQEKMERLNGENTVTMVHYGSYISVRATRPAAEKYDVFGKLDALKGTSEHILSCGGHSTAFSVRIDRAHTTSAVKLLLGAVGAGI